MKAKKPLIVTFIGDVYLLSSLLLIVSLFPKFPLRVGFSYIAVPFLSENIIKIFLCVVLLILSYGYLRLKKWGYWLMVTYNIFC